MNAVAWCCRSSLKPNTPTLRPCVYVCAALCECFILANLSAEYISFNQGMYSKSALIIKLKVMQFISEHLNDNVYLKEYVY